MRIAVIGGGPGGLYFSILIRKALPGCSVTVFERNRATDAFGFGVVFSDETLTVFEHADPPTYAAITERFTHWQNIDVHHRGACTTSGGHGFSALGRRALLGILQRRALELGVEILFSREAPPVAELAQRFDLVVGADGAASRVRAALAPAFDPQLERRDCRYMWLGTELAFDAFKFFIEETPQGVFQAHAYPYDETMSTFIVEAHEDAWRRAGLDAGPEGSLAPGQSDLEGVAFCERLFGEALGGRPLIANNSRWINFLTVRCGSWRAGNVVLLGDAAHTAHFSIGSGTKLAMEDAVALAWAFRADAGLRSGVGAALDAYEAERRPIVESTQRAAQASLEWFESLPQFVDQSRLQFAFNLLTRSRRVTYDNLRLRDPEFVSAVDAEFAAGLGDFPPRPRPPMFTPLRLRDLHLENRVIVSPMDMYSSVDGTPGDFHLVHLGARALGGAALVMSEMICVSAEGRITPGCGGMYRDQHVAAWRRIVRFAHEYGQTPIGAQLGHCGRKGSTKLIWDGIDEPLPRGNWPLIAPSAIPYSAANQVPREMTLADMDDVIRDFVWATRGAVDAGFDLLELHCAHGYLLSSFLSPLTNRRQDSYGGSLENRARFPLRVFSSVRAVWPEEKPISVRISATDWVDGGFDADEAVEFAAMLKGQGCDIVDVSTGQVWPEERPAFGRTYQTPFADRIRNVVGMPTIAVGAISSYDDVNTIILAGRADLCALARPHLYDPAWTLHAAAEQEYAGVRWARQYAAGSRKPPAGRGDGVSKELERRFEEPGGAGGPGDAAGELAATAHRPDVG
jgi:anthraniloyl-CoA monooxygenase